MSGLDKYSTASLREVSAAPDEANTMYLYHISFG